ncbi:MAG: serine/threonine-protein kinase [Deltaproteobacteria bacterium]
MNPGTILAGKYRLVSMLGHGGMGSVWRAERLGWEAEVAVKMMHLPGLQDPNSLARFQREAHLSASLRSVHIVQILDDGVDAATGTPFIVMELLEGESLAERLVRMRRLRPQVVAQIVSQIARALGRAHDAGLIHRDLKPDNVLIVRNDDEELVKVLDFGIAKWMGSPTKHGPRTISGQMLGTPVYMSPEQFGGSASIDHRADLWSLAVIACECLTGVRPFQGETLVSLALQVCSGNPPAPSSLGPVPDGFDAWFLRSVARDRDRRFPSARLMAEELRGLCGHTPLLWEAAATPPQQHLPREKTELEPVLELRRRSRTSEPQFPPTDLGSVMPAVRSHLAPAPSRSRFWFGLVAISMAALGFAVVMFFEGSYSSLTQLSSRLGQATRELRENLGSASGGGSTPAPTTIAGSLPASAVSAAPPASAPSSAAPVSDAQAAVVDAGSDAEPLSDASP